MKILVIGPGCTKCKQAEKNVREAVKIADMDAEIQKVADIMKMLELGVMATPAIIIDGVTVCSGQVPTVDQVVDWLKAHH